MKRALIPEEDISEIIKAISKALLDNYVFPEVAEQICFDLEHELKKGRYSDVSDPSEFASLLTQNLQKTNGDKHLRAWVRTEVESGESELSNNEQQLIEDRYRAQISNFGIPKIERLEGNIGYVDIRVFHRPSWGAETAIAAMNFLSNSEAIIFDLRNCGGGYPEMVALISSYLFEEQTHLNSLYWRKNEYTQQFWTLPHIQGKKFVGKPVYVLTSRRTFSGGEEFAYNLKMLGRAKLVGEQTGGAANPGDVFRIHKHLEAFISTGKAINPVSQDNWEGLGVEPDIEIKQEDALLKAHEQALRTVITNSPSGTQLTSEAEKALENIAKNKEANQAVDTTPVSAPR